MLLYRDLFSVFPTYVGVILGSIPFETINQSIPHVCGGDPAGQGDGYKDGLYSPRMWGPIDKYNKIYFHRHQKS